MSIYNNLTVVYGASGDVLGDCTNMERYATEYSLPHVKFVTVHVSRTTNALNLLNRKGIFPYSFYVVFKSWQKQAYGVAKDLMKTQQFDFCHMVGPVRLPRTRIDSNNRLLSVFSLPSAMNYI